MYLAWIGRKWDYLAETCHFEPEETVHVQAGACGLAKTS